MDNVRQMAGFGETPWWADGGSDPRYVKLDRLQTGEQMFHKSGQNFDVLQAPYSYTLPNGQRIVVPGQAVNYRGDTGEWLGTINDPSYHIIPNTALYDLVAEITDKAIFETAGVLGKGERVWAQARIAEYQIVKGDWSRDYLFVGTSHDCTMPLTAGLSSQRVVCANTWQMCMDGMKHSEMAGGPPIVRIMHRAGWEMNLHLAHKALGLSTKNSELMQEILGNLARVSMTGTMVSAFAKAMFPSLREDKTGNPPKDIQANREYLYSAFESDMNNIGAEGTGYTAACAMTQWVDHAKPEKGQDRRSWSWFGAGAQKRKSAIDWLVKNLLGK